MKFVIALLVSFSVANAMAISRIHILEKASHSIMKLAKTGEVPTEAVTKLHMMKVVATNTGFEVIAVLDHNEDHSKPIAHLKMTYDLKGKLTAHQYIDGYFNPAATQFVGASTALLFDLGTELVFEGDDADLLAYADGVYMVHLKFLAPSNQALFEMVDDNNKELELITNLNGDYVSHKFIN
jgi:hypothetical protein